jgi:hypothetical protein
MIRVRFFQVESFSSWMNRSIEELNQFLYSHTDDLEKRDVVKEILNSDNPTFPNQPQYLLDWVQTIITRTLDTWKTTEISELKYASQYFNNLGNVVLWWKSIGQLWSHLCPLPT